MGIFKKLLNNFHWLLRKFSPIYQNDVIENPTDKLKQRQESQKIIEQQKASDALTMLVQGRNRDEMKAENLKKQQVYQQQQAQVKATAMAQIEKLQQEYNTKTENTRQLTGAILDATTTIIQLIGEGKSKKERLAETDRLIALYKAEDDAAKRADDQRAEALQKEEEQRNGKYQLTLQDGYRVATMSMGTTEAQDLENAIAGDVEAQLNLGERYKNGNMIIKPGYVLYRSEWKKKAFEWYKKAAENDNAEAKYWLGEMYQNEIDLDILGLGIKRNDVDALYWYKKSAEQGYSNAITKVGQMMETAKKYSDAYIWYSRSGSHEYRTSDAYFGMGHFYEHGLGVPIDYNKAFDFYKLAGNADAYLRMAMLFKNGWVGGDQGSLTGSKCFEKAFEYYSSRWKNGGYIGAYGLGLMYEKGYGVPKDSEKALSLYNQASEVVDEFGPSSLALLAERGHAAAQCKLGTLYALGKFYPRDLDMAVMWLNKAESGGYSKAAAVLQVIMTIRKENEFKAQRTKPVVKQETKTPKKLPVLKQLPQLKQGN